MKRVLLLVAATVIAACAQMKPAPKLEDGEMAVPANYQTWPKALSAVQRPDVKQVREVYVNPTGQARKDQPYANGAVFVMENWAAKANTDGTLVVGPDGKMVKDKLLRVFLMGKGTGYGSKVANELKNGDWVYASYDAAGAKTADNLNGCRTCHLKFSSKDFVARHDDYVAKN